MELARLRSELAKAISPRATESEIIADRTRGTAHFVGDRQVEPAGFSSNRRASRIAAAGMSGSSVRAFTVQFKNAANRKVPRTQRANRIESASLRFLWSATASPRTETPPAT